MGAFSYIGQAANLCNLFMLKLHPETLIHEIYDLQRAIRFSPRNWLTMLHKDVSFKCLHATHSKHILILQSKTFHVPNTDYEAYGDIV